MQTGPPRLSRILVVALTAALIGAGCTDSSSDGEGLGSSSSSTLAPASRDDNPDPGTVLTPGLIDHSTLPDLPAGIGVTGVPLEAHGEGIGAAPSVPEIDTVIDGTIVALETDPATFLPSDSLLTFDAAGEPIGRIDFPEAAFAPAPGQASLVFRAVPQPGRLNLRLDSLTGQSWWTVDPIGRSRTQYLDPTTAGNSTLPPGTQRWMVTEREVGAPIVTDLTDGSSFDLDGSGLGPLTVRPSPFTPDDEWMVLARSVTPDDQSNELRVVRADTPTETAVAWTADDGFEFRSPVIDPTGTRLAALLTATGTDSGGQLVILDLLTGEVADRQVTEGTWLPEIWLDEHRLVVFDSGSGPEEPRNDAVYDVDTQEIELAFVRPEGDPVDQLISPDSNSIFYVGPALVSQVDLDTGRTLQGVHPPGLPASSYPDWDGTADRRTESTWWVTSGEDVPRLWTLGDQGMSIFAADDDEVVLDGTRSIVHERTGQAVVLNDTNQPWLMQADATQTRLDTGLDGIVLWASWAPSGTKLVLSTVSAEGTLSFIVDLDGNVLTELGPGHTPVWLAG